MTFLGLDFRRLNSLSFTFASALATLIWLVAISIAEGAGGGTDAFTAGQALVAIFWGCLCAVLGLRFRNGREIAVYAGGAALLLFGYQTAAGFLA